MLYHPQYPYERAIGHHKEPRDHSPVKFQLSPLCIRKNQGLKYLIASVI